MNRLVIIITGTSKGIGKELCMYYLKKGHIVHGCSRSDPGINHPEYQHHLLDVSDENAVTGMVRKIVDKNGRVDVLINNAGIASMNPIILTPLPKAINIFNTNYFGTLLFIREAGKAMIRQKKGRIVNFSTVATPLRLEGESVYASSKAAVENLTEIAARELAPYAITVNAVGPTPTPTGLIKSVSREKIDALIARQAIQRLGTIDDIINVIDFFIDDKSDFITGQTIYLGGVNY